MRQFPKDHSLTADEVGSMDVMAILVSNQPFDYPAINKRMNESGARGLDARLVDVLGNELLGADRQAYTDGETIGAKADASANALAIVLEIEKR